MSSVRVSSLLRCAELLIVKLALFESAASPRNQCKTRAIERSTSFVALLQCNITGISRTADTASRELQARRGGLDSEAARQTAKNCSGRGKYPGVHADSRTAQKNFHSFHPGRSAAGNIPLLFTENLSACFSYHSELCKNAPFSLAQVCERWRTVVIDTPYRSAVQKSGTAVPSALCAFGRRSTGNRK